MRRKASEEDLAQVYPDSLLKDMWLQSPMIMQWHMMNLFLPLVAHDFLQPLQHTAFRGTCRLQVPLSHL